MEDHMDGAVVKVVKPTDLGIRTEIGPFYQQSVDHTHAMQLFQYEQPKSFMDISNLSCQQRGPPSYSTFRHRS